MSWGDAIMWGALIAVLLGVLLAFYFAIEYFLFGTLGA
jgi:hypothetical protein